SACSLLWHVANRLRNSEAGCSLCRLQIAMESLPVPRTPDEKNGSPAPTSGGRAPKKPGVFSKLFAEVAKVGSREVGRAWVFGLALGTVVVWAISGPFFGFSDTWHLVINTGTTIVTFLMVFLIHDFTTAMPMPKRRFVTLRQPVSRTTIFPSSQATPTIGTRQTARGSRVRSRIVISTARMTALRQQAPAPASARPWAARRGCSQ